MGRWLLVGGLLVLCLVASAAAETWSPREPGEVLLARGSVEHGHYSAAISSPYERGKGAPCVNMTLEDGGDGVQGGICFGLKSGAIFPAGVRSGRPDQLTLVGAVYPPKIIRLVLKFSNRPDIAIQLRRLSDSKRKKAGLAPLRYRFRVLRGPLCLTRAIALGRHDRVIRVIHQTFYCPQTSVELGPTASRPR